MKKISILFIAALFSLGCNEEIPYKNFRVVKNGAVHSGFYLIDTEPKKQVRSTANKRRTNWISSSYHPEVVDSLQSRWSRIMDSLFCQPGFYTGFVDTSDSYGSLGVGSLSAASSGGFLINDRSYTTNFAYLPANSDTLIITDTVCNFYGNIIRYIKIGDKVYPLKP